MPELVRGSPKSPDECRRATPPTVTPLEETLPVPNDMDDGADASAC